MQKNNRILFAVGGTGGHLFPAQALARDLMEQRPDIELLFAGGLLASNRYFQREAFPYREVASATPFRGGLFKSVDSFVKIGRGVRESIDLLNHFKPQLVVGFGSFYSFPLLCAAWLKKIPIILFESNAYPGRVNRLFAGRALFSALQFEETAEHLKGEKLLVRMPYWCERSAVHALSKEEARRAYGLDPSIFTLLVFGGSQGAQAINSAALELSLSFPFQIIHLTGEAKSAKEAEIHYYKRGVRAKVKGFEDKMHIAWRAADLVVCRSGAATLSELIIFEVPGLLVPFPQAADNHQEINAQVMERIGGATWMPQGALTAQSLATAIEDLMSNNGEKWQRMKQKIAAFKMEEHEREELAQKVLQKIL